MSEQVRSVAVIALACGALENWRRRVPDVARLRMGWKQLGVKFSSARGTLLELGVLILAAVWMSAPILNFDSRLVSAGADYLMTIQFHHVWSRWSECGACFFWNGGLNGGSPAFADLFPSSLHPLVIFTTMGWGVLNGSKLALAGIFFMAGLAQWWLARVMGLGWLARLWGGLLAIVAGNIVGRMQMGWFGVALATASAALVFPPLVQVAGSASRRAAILLGIVFACALVAGQGYIQFGLLLVLPLTLVLLPWGEPNFWLVVRRYTLAGGLAFLLSAPLLLPFLMNASQMTKAADVNLGGIQSFTFIPLSFVVNNARFYGTEILGMIRFPALYTNYIGWLAALLALVGVRMARPGQETRVMLFLLLTAMAAILAASLEPRQFLIHLFPKSGFDYQIMSLRSSPVIAGLAVLPIVGLATLGVDRLYARLNIHLQLAFQGTRALRALTLPLNWLLVPILLWGVWNVAQVTRGWLYPATLLPAVARVIDALKTPTLEWVNFPWGEPAYLEAAMAKGLKISSYPFAWGWKDRPAPEPLVAAENKWTPENMTASGTVPGEDAMKMYRASSEREYARVLLDSGDTTICAARGAAGDIDVHCEMTRAGTLTVKENNWPGWGAAVDGKFAALGSGQWLNVALPAGAHDIQLRYRPWEGILGFILFGLGCVMCVYLWRQADLTNDGAPVPLSRAAVLERIPV